MTRTEEVLTSKLLTEIQWMEAEGWSTRTVVVLGPMSLVVFERDNETQLSN